MVGFKVVIGTKDGKCHQKEIPEEDSKNLVGKKIGDTIKGELIGLTGYEFTITGGTDYAGFPMRKDIVGTGRKRILAVAGIGLKKKAKGIRKRKTVCGNTIHAKISQINLKVLKEGKEKLGAAPEAKEGEAPAEEQKEAPKEAPKEEKKE
ncbi:30S ribosomal protein S6e [Candidatus Woesearchaeota archaeon]|nr:30S ribosomal protein S6e [Candidatus Woesearchaeota archaeon]